MAGEITAQSDATPRKGWWFGTPLYIRILGGVALGVVTGMLLGERAKPLGDVSKLVISLLKALATPLILFAVLDAFLTTHIPARKGFKLIAISLANAAVAIIIGLSVANLLRGGEEWAGHLDSIKTQVKAKAEPKAPTLKKDEPEVKPTLDPMQNLSAYVPENLVEPFRKNNIITVVLLAVLAGAALRKLQQRTAPQTVAAMKTVENVVHAIFQAFTVMLEWIIQIVPVAVFGVVAKVTGEADAGVLKVLAVFLYTIVLGLFIHAVVYYSLLLWVVGRASPRRFYSNALDAIVTALSCGSSLATLPVTLRCLNDKLKISPGNARLAACVGTNLNHDGIILYEAAAAIFIAQVFGYHLGIGQQLTVALASLLAGIGISGVPEAGLITLPLVLQAAGLPEEIVLPVIPLLFTVDWFIGRLRATTNVISDMTVATLLERLDPPEEAGAVLPE